MTRMIRTILMLAPALMSATVCAQGPSAGSLEMATRMNPSDGGAAIELANAYWREGRTSQAYGAYRRALALDNVMMEMPDGNAIWSHEVATRAITHQSILTAR